MDVECMRCSARSHGSPAGKLTYHSLIGKLVADDTKVSRDTLVQLICLFSSGLMGHRV